MKRKRSPECFDDILQECYFLYISQIYINNHKCAVGVGLLGKGKSRQIYKMALHARVMVMAPSVR